MGVDYTAFACWGVRVTGVKAQDFESNEMLLSRAEDKVGYAEYGSRQYGGDGGWILLIDETYASIDMRREACAHPIPNRIPSNRWESVLFGIRDKLRERGVTIDFDGEFGWFVCGLVH